MTCPDCAIAKDRLWSGFRSDCKGCTARSIARSPAFHKARLSGKLFREYLEMLERVGVKHEEVKAAASMDFENRPNTGAICA